MSLTELDIQFIQYALMAFAGFGGAFLFLSLWFSPAVSVLIILVGASSAASVTATAWGSYSLASIDPTGLAVVIISIVATMVSGFSFYRLSNTINPLRLMMFGAVYVMFTGYMVTMNYLLIAQMLERGAVINDRAQAQESMVLDLQGQIGEANATLLRAQSELSEITAQDRALTAQIAQEARTGCPDTLRNGQPSNCKTLKDQKAALVPAREAAQSALSTATATIERLQAMTSRDEKAEIMDRRGLAQQSIDLYLPEGVFGVDIRQIIAGFVGSMIEMAATMSPTWLMAIFKTSRSGWLLRLFRPAQARRARRMRVERDQAKRERLEAIAKRDEALAQAAQVGAASEEVEQRIEDVRQQVEKEAEARIRQELDKAAFEHERAMEAAKAQHRDVVEELKREIAKLNNEMDQDPLQMPGLIDDHFDEHLVKRVRDELMNNKALHRETMNQRRIEKSKTFRPVLEAIYRGEPVDCSTEPPRRTLNAVKAYVETYRMIEEAKNNVVQMQNRRRGPGQIVEAR